MPYIIILSLNIYSVCLFLDLSEFFRLTDSAEQCVLPQSFTHSINSSIFLPGFGNGINRIPPQFDRDTDCLCCVFPGNIASPCLYIYSSNSIWSKLSICGMSGKMVIRISLQKALVNGALWLANPPATQKVGDPSVVCLHNWLFLWTHFMKRFIYTDRVASFNKQISIIVRFFVTNRYPIQYPRRTERRIEIECVLFQASFRIPWFFLMILFGFQFPILKLTSCQKTFSIMTSARGAVVYI